MKLNVSKKKLVIFIVIIIALLLVIWGIRYFFVSGGQKGFTSSNGRVEATEVFIATKLAGRIAEIRVDEGDVVKKGQVLAIMDTATLEAQLDEAEAQLEKEKRNKDAAIAARHQKESELEAAQATEQQRISEYRAESNRFHRSAKLVKQRALSVQQLDDDRAKSESAKAAVDAATAKIESAKASLASSQADEIAADSSIKAAQATIDRIQADINDSQLQAPRDGRIQYRVAQPGEVLSAGGRVLNMIDTQNVYMTVFLPTDVVGKLNIGDEARIILDALPNHALPAHISYIDNVAQFTPKSVETATERQKLTFRVKLSIEPQFLVKHADKIKTGLPGVGWVKISSEESWPTNLQVTDK